MLVITLARKCQAVFDTNFENAQTYLQNCEVLQHAVHHVLLRQVLELPDEVDHVLAHGAAVQLVDEPASLETRIFRLNLLHHLNMVSFKWIAIDISFLLKYSICNIFKALTCLPKLQTFVDTWIVMFSGLSYLEHRSMLNFGFDAAPITPKLSFTAIGSYLSHEVCKDRSSYGSDCFEN